MTLTSQVLRYVASRFLAEPRRTQHVARTNAARASATLRGRRREREGVEAYLQSLRNGDA
jgi:hypothetical protein